MMRDTIKATIFGKQALIFLHTHRRCAGGECVDVETTLSDGGPHHYTANAADLRETVPAMPQLWDNPHSR